MGVSLASQLVEHPWLRQLPRAELAALEYDWTFWSRPEQRQPPGAWQTWVICAGRGFGKTRTGAETIREEVDRGEIDRFALVGATAADVRDVMVLGESGLLNVFPPRQRPKFEPSKRRVVFHNGAVATLYSAEEPDRLRGPQHGFAWCDELAAWSKLDQAWADLQMGLRLGDRPRTLITTTPRPLKFLIGLVERAADDPTIVITKGSTFDNPHLPPTFIREVTKAYGGTRLGRQELEGEILGDAEGSLFRREWFRYLPEAPKLTRVVVAVDPAITVRNDETGIVVVGRAGDQGYVLEDLSGSYTPDEWGHKAVDAARRWRLKAPTIIVAETNRGGMTVASTIRNFDRSVQIREVRADKGKDTRAEPVSALYEQRRIFHVGKFEKLENQMCTWDPTSQEMQRARRQATSPDRMDALVWGMLELGFHLGVAKFKPLPQRTPVQPPRKPPSFFSP
jgi:phage terminase large subunit-like protein